MNLENLVSTPAAPVVISPQTELIHVSQINAFVKPKVFHLTNDGIEVRTPDGRLLQSIPFQTVTKIWEYNGLSATSADGSSFRIRYSRIYSLRNRPVYVCNTSDLGASGQKYTPEATNESETFDWLMTGIKHHVSIANPLARITTGWMTVVVCSVVNILIGAGMLAMPVGELFMGTRQTLTDWVEYAGLLAFFWWSGATLLCFGVMFVIDYWPTSKLLNKSLPLSESAEM